MRDAAISRSVRTRYAVVSTCAARPSGSLKIVSCCLGGLQSNAFDWTQQYRTHNLLYRLTTHRYDETGELMSVMLITTSLAVWYQASAFVTLVNPTKSCNRGDTHWNIAI